MKKTLAILIILFCSYCVVMAQDPQFTQSYAVPLYLAPSFAGTTSGSRLTACFRDQWPKVPKEFVTLNLSYDHFFPGSKSGVGFFAFQDRAGSGALTSTLFALQYSYVFRINKKVQVRPGIQMTHTTRKVDFYSLTFGDQLSFYDQRPVTLETPVQQRITYLDFAASLLIYHEEFWGGLCIDHLAQANQSFTGDKSIVPMKYSIFAGKKILASGRRGRYDEESFTITAYYKAQDKFDQLDLGVYWTKQPLVIGLWYRGLPLIKSYEGHLNNDAVNILIGYKHKDFSIGYSYDFTISRLISNSGGAHEVTVSYLFFQDQKVTKKRKKQVVACPKFTQSF